ncbi:hypothetical protein CYMTET_39891 [Cymbomonas tetramitiformis]|uniref:Uncharacterized protein n=1 Tax=Cymbomonas tetramitiformis TaxID=36881 RepID=A0AAE0F3I6_9CHLO|nr:hypothetical protein CYMTET_39891 [Cymbomonas tetramitiformis]
MHATRTTGQQPHVSFGPLQGLNLALPLPVETTQPEYNLEMYQTQNGRLLTRPPKQYTKEEFGYRLSPSVRPGHTGLFRPGDSLLPHGIEANRPASLCVFQQTNSRALRLLNSDLSRHGVSLQALDAFKAETKAFGADVPLVTRLADRWAVLFKEDPFVNDLVRSISLGAGRQFDPSQMVMTGANYVKEGFEHKDQSHFEKVRVVHSYSKNEDSSINSATKIPKHKWQSASDALAYLTARYFMVKVDIKSAYRHFSVALQHPRASWEEATEAVHLLHEVLEFLGLTVTWDKCEGPGTDEVALVVERSSSGLPLCSGVLGCLQHPTDNTPTKGMLEH